MIVLFAIAWMSALNAPSTDAVYTVDAQSQKPISPYIYGNNFPDWDTQGKLFTMARMGGNRLTAYNWETNASNAGNDYQNQSDGYMGESNEPGWAVRQFMKPAQKHGMAVLLTVPTAGYVAADKNGGGDVNKTPNYLETRFHKSYAKKPSKFAFPPDTKDKAVYQDEFVAWVEKTKTSASPVWFSLDNEPDLWGSTHSRIWSKNPTYAQIIANNIMFASAIKDVAPKSLIFGPANYGWQGFRTFQNATDAGGRDFLDVYLAALKQAETEKGKRLLDVLDIHWYPEAQGGGQRIAFAGGGSAVEAARVQAPRSLWDPTYVEDSWIANTLGKKPIVLLPKLISQIEKHYPGTKLGITEYNYGGGKLPGGMIAQADVLGIFGREGLFSALAFVIAKDDVAQNAAFRAYRDYDGKGSKFGDLGLKVVGGDPATTSVYAALDAKASGRMTLIVINKVATDAPLTIQIKGFKPSSGQAFTIKSTNFGLSEPSAVPVSASGLKFKAPGLSVSTIELRR